MESQTDLCSDHWGLVCFYYVHLGELRHLGAFGNDKGGKLLFLNIPFSQIAEQNIFKRNAQFCGLVCLNLHFSPFAMSVSSWRLLRQPTVRPPLLEHSMSDLCWTQV